MSRLADRTVKTKHGLATNSLTSQPAEPIIFNMQISFDSPRTNNALSSTVNALALALLLSSLLLSVPI